MNIAKVIVDVPASTVNQTFDYKVPERFTDMIEPGMRVIVPFGPRKITGFVIQLVSESEFDKLRAIEDVLDLTPVLTPELLKLGKWLADETLSLYITTYQAMLPAVLKSKYERRIELKENVEIPENIQAYFAKNAMLYEELLETDINLSELKRLIQANKLDMNYYVKSQEVKKYETIIIPVKTVEEMKTLKTELRANAHRQIQLYDFFIKHPEPIEQGELFARLNLTQAHLRPLIKNELIKLEKKEVYRNPHQGEFEQTENIDLNIEQKAALKPILDAVNEEKSETFLLYGVTGSGKTEVYLQAIEQVIEQNKEAIVLVPEIALTPQMVERFKGRFGEKVAVLHSALSTGEKYDEWRKIHRKEVQVVVGARSAIFAPFENLGIIIIDEEHETTYKQEDNPRYHARDIAIHRAETNGCPLVLGSATPTLESFARAEKNVYSLLKLSHRTNNKPMPEVEIVDMRDELHSGNRTMFSNILTEKIQEKIEANEQIVLLLNRRGFSNFALCRDCGHVETCPHCDISLTYHKGHHALKCHYCLYEIPLADRCSKCKSDLIGFFGTGTERVEEELNKLMPKYKVIRMDVDTTSRKGAHERLLTKFRKKEADILLGTQMIAKGLDFENVTLVGVLAADSMLHLPDFRSSEKTFQLLTQVSGRAGRHELPGEVIVQTYTPDHYSVLHASKYDYLSFYQHEMAIRRTFRYPPYVYLALITLSDEDLNKVIQMANNFAQKLGLILSKESTILGPTPSPLSRIKRRYRYQIIIKYRYEADLSRKLKTVYDAFESEFKKGLQIAIDINPYQLM